MKTYQDYEKAKEQGQSQMIDFIRQAINDYKASDMYKTALEADEYEAERNVSILRWTKYLYTMQGQKVPDYTAGNNRIASNFFHRLTTQRVAYSLGNGISFSNASKETIGTDNVVVDKTKEALGKDFDTIMYKAGKFARQHACSYLFWNVDHIVLFKATEFVPLYDEDDGKLKAGFRFWSLDWEKRPVIVVVYDLDGFEKYRTKKDSKGLDIELIEEKRGYKQTIAHNEVDPDEVVGESNYGSFPIFPLWGNSHHQSDLVGMKSKIDSYDLVKSGFANDLEECAEIYWIIGNALGETDESLAKFRDRMKLNHIVSADTMNSTVTPYTQEIPVNARNTLLESLRNQIYEDYGALDVHTVAAGATNDHIDAAYQPMDDEADDFEYQIIECIRAILNLLGIDDMPLFNRNRISNQKERTEMVMLAANYLDDETILKKLPFITSDEVDKILIRKDAMDQGAFEVEEEEEKEEVKTVEEV